MRVVVEKPPMFDEISAVFPAARKADVIFSWGDIVYNPGGCMIPRAVMAHEAVHGERQGTDEADIRSWWTRYIKDPAFRFAEEVIAHRAEYRALCSWTKDRNARAQGMHVIAMRLASPLYGGLTTYQQARKAIA